MRFIDALLVFSLAGLLVTSVLQAGFSYADKRKPLVYEGTRTIEDGKRIETFSFPDQTGSVSLPAGLINGELDKGETVRVIVR
jgi:hypothetical protein